MDPPMIIAEPINVTGNATALPFSTTITGILGFLSAAGSLITVLGNILVIAAFFVERALRTPTNYFIASLAVTDLLIGVFSMNFYTLYLLLGKWPLGEVFCDIWLSLDYTACLVSQYTVFLITVDRFCSVKIPAKYRNWRSEKKVRIMVAATWIIPSSIFFCTIMGWPYFTGSRTRESGECMAEFTRHTLFNTLFTIGYFWITLFVMIVLYMGIYNVALNLQRKSDAKHQKMTSLVSMAGQTMSRIGVGVSRASEIGDQDSLYGNRQGPGNGTSGPHGPSASGGGGGHADGPRTHLGTGVRLQKPRATHTEHPSRTQTSYFSNQSISRDDERSSSPMLPSDSDMAVEMAPPARCYRNSKQQTLAVIESPILVEFPNEEDSNAAVPAPVATTTITSPVTAASTTSTGLTPKGQGQSHGPPPGGCATRGGLLNPTPTTSNDSDYHTSSAISLDVTVRGGGRSDVGIEDIDEYGMSHSDSNANLPLPVSCTFAVNTGSNTMGDKNNHNNNDDDAGATTVSLSQLERYEGLKYIDQDSLNSSDNLKYLLEVFPRLPPGIDTLKECECESPVWVRRDSRKQQQELAEPQQQASQPPQPPQPPQQQQQGSAKATKPTATRQRFGSSLDNSSVGADGTTSSHENVAFKDDDVAVVVGPSTSVKTPLMRQMTSFTATTQNTSRFTSYNTQTSNESAQAGPASNSRRKGSFDASLREVTKKLTRRKRRKRSKKEVSRGSRTENRARKALRTITLILGAFVACWTPYHVIILIKGFCDRTEVNYSCVNDHLYSFSYWLCYLNSPINPFCYALANAQFKKTFLRILRLDIHRT